MVLLVGVFPDLFVGIVELDEEDDGDRLQAAVAVLVLGFLRHAVQEVILMRKICLKLFFFRIFWPYLEELVDDDEDAVVDVGLVHLDGAVLEVVEQLVERLDVGAHRDAQLLQVVDGHQVDDDREPEREQI